MRTFCQNRKCLSNNNIPSRKHRGAKPRCTKAFIHLDEEGQCTEAEYKPITFKATRREPVVIKGLFH